MFLKIHFVVSHLDSFSKMVDTENSQRHKINRKPVILIIS
jgi:hypothetical protein